MEGENIKKRGTKYTPDIFREGENIIDNGTLYTPEVFRCVYFSSSPIL